MKNSIFLFLVPAFLLSMMFFGCGQKSDKEHSVDDGHDMGEVNFEISCNAGAQEKFEHGLAMLHHMMYEESADLFREALKEDPDCAIGYWGIAMTQLRPLWSPPSEQEFEKGLTAIEKADSIGTSSAKERDYIATLNTFYQTAKEKSFKEGLRAWSQSLEGLHQKYPEDIDAGAFYGLSLLATASPDDTTYSNQRKAGALFEELLEKAPDHPGLFHYTIHAYDNPVLAEKALEMAHDYDKLAPEVPHALHMPSHIFVRLGKWDETIDWNKRSADAALKHQVNGMISFHYVHAVDYLIYAYLQQGRDKKAKQVLDEMLAKDNYQANFASAYGIAAAQARYPLERKKWDEAVNIQKLYPDNFPWEDFPQYEAITHWARGFGAARTADIQRAQEAVKKLKELHERTLDNEEDYWAMLVDVQRMTIEAWIAQEEEKNETALQLMRNAAEMEDSVEKHPVTPGDVLPARELLGDMLLLNNKPEEALTAYEATLAISPNRFNSLYGAAKAAEMAGKTDQAGNYYQKLLEIAVISESERSELKEAERFLSEN